ncbi:MAG: exosortase/archaeosortase family protein [Terrimicrobiaceae bacterium]
MVSGHQKQSAWDIAISVVAWAGAILLFWKSLRWLAGTALAREQIAHAATVLIFGLVFLLRERPETTPVAMRFGRHATEFFAGACLGASLAWLLHQPLLMLCALGFLAGAVLLFVYGDPLVHLALGFGMAFSGFTFLSVLFPFADWPLRLLAGRTATWFFGLFGHPVQLGLAGDPLRLILVDGGAPFEVATECNGFGIISGCILLALLLVFSRRLRVADKLVVLALAPLLGLFSNAARIFLIVLLAPAAGKNYQFMHEGVGILLFFGTLAVLWWLVAGLPERRQSPSSETHTNSDIS